YVSAINMPLALEAIRDWIERKARNYVCVTPAHSIMDAYYGPEFKQILNQSGMTTPDGMAVVWLLKLHGFKNAGRVYGPDLMLAVCEESIQHGWSHFLYGGAPGVADRLAGNLRQCFPNLKINGIFSPPFTPLSPDEDREIVDRINRANADIVWVGISAPKQEKWMVDHIERLNCSVLIGVGAAFDFLSGNKSQAPRWVQRSGFEWLFRFIQEP
ncbi:MAG TPA: WecB/TagA/CpsF family glycosyltransferase, partial [Anaerolinea sp.]|nr:WecB/TagA/CpsF family glycosyltransferase [Anaerolinea sp.]